MREAGLKLGTPRALGGRARFAARVRELAGEDRSVMAIVGPLLKVLATMLEQLARLTRHVLDTVREDRVCRRLMTVPGVGPITALTFRATIDDPARFGKSRVVGAHLGLTLGRYQSGETDIQGRISRGTRRVGPHRALRGRSHAAGPQPQVVAPAGLGHAGGPRPRRGGAQARHDPASHVARRLGLPLRRRARRMKPRRKKTMIMQA